MSKESLKGVQRNRVIIKFYKHILQREAVTIQEEAWDTEAVEEIPEMDLEEMLRIKNKRRMIKNIHQSQIGEEEERK